jgi:CheY-like chemotaxis protein
LPKRPDIVVTDLRMALMGGAELARTFFARGLASRLLFVTGSGPPGTTRDWGLYCDAVLAASTLKEVGRALL